MSGGVDSSVAAALLQRDGWEVVGATLRLLPCQDDERLRSCCGVEAEVQARAVASRLGIPHYMVEASRRFEVSVLRPSWEAYAAGRTPSPCPLCNRHLKLGALLERADSLGVSHVATGHYARVRRSASGSELLRGADPDKDQSYFLFALRRAQLARLLTPLGALRKPEVRALAAGLGFANAGQPGSQDACLLGPGDSFAEGLRLRFGGGARAGALVGERGEVLGEHAGLHHFTIGQRRGLGIALGRPAWVSRIDPLSAEVHISTQPAALLSSRVQLVGAHWLVRSPPFGTALRCEVQLRYRASPTPVRVEVLEGGALSLELGSPQRAVTPGQAAVLYEGDKVLGGGWIHWTARDPERG